MLENCGTGKRICNPFQFFRYNKGQNYLLNAILSYMNIHIAINVQVFSLPHACTRAHFLIINFVINIGTGAEISKEGLNQATIDAG